MRLVGTKGLGAEIINFDNEDPVDRIKKETNGKGAICIDAVGFEAGGHFAGNGNGGHIHNITGNENNNREIIKIGYNKNIWKNNRSLYYCF